MVYREESGLNHEADRVADSIMQAFNNVIVLLTKEQQLRAAKRVLLRVRTLVESMESKLG